MALRTTSRFHSSLAVILLCGSSVLGLAGPAFAQETQGSSAQAQDEGLDQSIVVTGTRIGGVAPVGSALVQLGPQDIQAAGLTSTADMLNTIPSVLQIGAGNSYAGGQAQQGNTLNAFTFGKSPNIRGLGVGATLSLVNGHRVPYEGGNMNTFDGDNYPAQMLQRIDVVQDGGSALYGADAIAGTVNYILRNPEDTLEVHGTYGHNVGQDSYSVTTILGQRWNENSDGDGGFILSYQHSYNDAFAASARPDLYNDDLSPYGGAPSSLFAAPGNVLVNGTYYSIPRGQDGRTLTLSQLGTTPNRLNTWTGIDAIPRVKADRFALNIKQNITDWLELFGDALYVRRDIAINGPGGANINRVAVFGAPPIIPNSNPFSPCNPSHYPGGVVTGPADLLAACATGGLAVTYSTVHVIGPPTRKAVTETWNYGGGANIRLPFDWTLSLSAFAGGHDAPSVTTHTGGSPNPIFGTFNFFCDPTAFECADQATVSEINGRVNKLINRNKYLMQDYSANANGTLFSLPGGEVKMAVGAQRYIGSFQNENNFGGNNLNERRVWSFYGEVYVPLVSADMDVPLIYRLELNVSGRQDDYSDAGITRNPKIGFNWWPTEGIKIFGSYGTSFRAPGLADNDPTSQSGIIPGPVSGTQISPAICSLCQGPAYTSAAVYQTIGGANRDLQPETSTSWSLGVDWTPPAIPGLSASVKYWWVKYEGLINAPAYNVGSIAAINRGIYNSQIIYNPTLFPELAANNPVAFFGSFPTINAANPACAAALGQNVTTQAVFNSMIQCLNTGGERGGLFGAPVDPSRVLAMVNGRRINAGSTQGDGFDVTLNYSFDTDMGGFRLGAVAGYIRNWKVAPIQGAPATNEVNRFGNPLRFKGRVSVGWDRDFGFGRLSANAFMNYTNAYSMDVGQLPVGVAASYAEIDSYTTFDLTLGYETRSALNTGVLNDISLTVSIQNLFDQDPPLVVNQAGLAGSSVLFDPSNASPLGRTLQVQLSKRF